MCEKYFIFKTYLRYKFYNNFSLEVRYTQLVFNRVEQKYILSQKQYEALIKNLPSNVKIDKYGVHTICNIYYDTKTNEIIRNSIEKPIYKEKIRIRSYGIPTLESNVFLEIKKKYNGIVNKRRVRLTLQEIYDYIENKIKPKSEMQILKEIDYFLGRYNLDKKIFIAYDREAYFDEKDESFRMTFDRNIRSRECDVRLENGDYGEKLFKEDYLLMELKTNGAIPLWLVKNLSELKIYPTSFSKYGEIYKKGRLLNVKGEKKYV